MSAPSLRPTGLSHVGGWSAVARTRVRDPLDTVTGPTGNGYSAATLDEVDEHLARLTRFRHSPNLTVAGAAVLRGDIDALLDRRAYIEVTEG